jgi:hypothetical protein
MTSQTGKKRRCWRRAITGGVASSALAVGLLLGVGSATAHADVLDDIAAEYMTGAGGGQVSNFVKESLQLRALGFRPSKGNLQQLQDALEKRPNQTPLVEALMETVSYQRTLQARAAASNSTPGGVTFGINQLPPGQTPDPTNPDNTGIFIGPSGGITQPVG